MTDPNQPNANQTTEPAAKPQETTKPRKRRKWPYVVIGIFLLLLILILLIPTIASTAPVRSMVVSTINDNLNGKIAINDWSIGWTSGVTIEGVKIDDEKGSRVLEVSSIRVPMPLLSAIGGNYDLGEVVIDKPNLVNVVVNPDGTTNLEKLAKPGPAEPEPTEETVLPNVKGKIIINDLRGTISGGQLLAPVTIEPSDIKVEIPDINSPISADGGITYRVGAGATPSTISFAGKVDAIENNKVDTTKLSDDQTVTLKDVDLNAAAPFLGNDTTLAGIANGNLQVKAQGLQSLGASGNVTVANFSYGGAALSGDTYQSSKVDIPIDVSSADRVLKINNVKVETDHVLVTVTGSVPQAALENVAAQKAPGAAGAIAIKLNTKDVKGLTNQLRNTLALQKEVQIDGGTLEANVDVNFAPENVAIKQKLDVAAQGTNAGKPVKLDPVHLETALTALPTGKAIPDLRDITLNLTSAFATATGGGKSINDLLIEANFDLAKAHAQFAQFVDFAGQTFAGTGKLTVSSKGNLAEAGGKGDVSANLALDNIKLTNPQGGQLNQRHIELATNAAIARGATDDAPTTINVSALNLAGSDNLFSVKKVEQTPLVVTMVKDQVTANGQIALAANLKALLDTLNTYNNTPAPALNQPGQLQSGNFAGTIKLASAASGTDVALDGAIDSLTVTTAQQPIANEKVTIALAANASPDFNVITVPNVQVDSSFANTTITDALLDRTAKATIDMLQRAKVQVTVPDINKALAVSEAFSPPATQPTTQPFNIAGSAVVSLDVTRDKATKTTNVTIPTLTASKLNLSRGNRTYAFAKDVNLKLTAALAGAGDKIDKLDVKQLEGDLGGLATLSMPAPISVTNLSAPTPSANGKISLAGAIEPVTQLLAVVQGADPMPYRGDYALTQNISTSGNNIQLAGDVTVNKLVVLDATTKQPAFSEDRLVLANDIAADTSTKTAMINNVALDMASSKAAGVVIKGAVADWEVKRNLQNVTLNLAYNLEKLWPMIKPMLAPETQQQLADLKIAGAFNRTFNITGSYPAKDDAGKELAFNEAIKFLTAHGAIAVQLLNTSGLDLSDFELPITLANGQLATLYGDRPKGERTAKPAKFNGGTLDLNSILIDLTQEVPRLAIGKNQPLIRGAETNELLMRNLGQYANSLFAKADRAQGKLDITVEYCEFVPLGSSLTADTKGRARILFALSDMQIVNPIGEQFVRSFVGQLQGVKQLTAAIPGLANSATTDMSDAKTFAGRIDQSSITLENGKITQDITLQIVDTQRVDARTRTGAATRRTENVLMPLTVKGDLSLASMMQNLNVVFPARVIARSIGNDDWEKFIVENFPNGVPFRLGGATSDPKVLPPANLAKVGVDWAVRRFVGDKVPGLKDAGSIGDILTGKKPQQPAQPAQPSQNQPQATQPAQQPDPVGTLIDIFGKPKKEDPKKKK